MHPKCYKHLKEAALAQPTDYGHSERAVSQKSQTFGLGQTNWAKHFEGTYGIFRQTTAPILAL